MTIEEAKKILRDEAKKIVSKWGKTGLLDRIITGTEKSDMSVLIESQEKEFIMPELTDEQIRYKEAIKVLDAAKIYVK